MFKYKGGNDSITYAYLWSPFADFLLRFVPESMAPNLISTISLVMLVGAHLLFVWGLNSYQKIEGWKMVVMGISIFLYQNLDNLDGKQARKTSKDIVKQALVPLWVCFLIMVLTLSLHS